MINFTELLKNGMIAEQDAHGAADKEKLGNIRGGSIGVVADDGTIYGKCMRLHYLRMLGWQNPIDLKTSVMFATGLANEDVIMGTLNAGNEVDVLAEEEYPVVYKHKGLDVTGRPDLVLFEKDSLTKTRKVKKGVKPVAGIELKNMSSIWTINGVVGKGTPNGDHLVQSGFYSYKLDVPYKLCYTSGVMWHTLYNKWVGQNFAGRFNLAEHKEDKYGEPQPFKLLPGRFTYDLTWEDDKLVYGIEGSDQKVETAISKAGYDRYVDQLADLYNGTNTELPARPTKKHVNGDKLNYSQCTYCSFNDICNSTNDLTTFTDSAKIEITKAKKELAEKENRTIS